jgi:hypothetical protein
MAEFDDLMVEHLARDPRVDSAVLSVLCGVPIFDEDYDEFTFAQQLGAEFGLDIEKVGAATDRCRELIMQRIIDGQA